jgi:hypothetical protein
VALGNGGRPVPSMAVVPTTASLWISFTVEILLFSMS